MKKSLLCIAAVIFGILLHFSSKAQTAQMLDSGGDTKNKSPFKSLSKLYTQSYEDNTVGYAWNKGDEQFLDCRVSVVYQIRAFDYLLRAGWNTAHRTLNWFLNREAEKDSLGWYRAKRARFDLDSIDPHILSNLHLNFAFTDQFGFYINDRFSSPVVQKRLNPYLFFSYSPVRYLVNFTGEFGYGHESNGQFIQDANTFNSTVDNALYEDEHDPNHPNKYLHGDRATAIQETIDYNSRGWDYWRVRMYYNFFLPHFLGMRKFFMQTDFSYRYYLHVGFLEGPQENYRPFEYPWYGSDLVRAQVSGLAFACNMVRSQAKDSKAFSITKLNLSWETGTQGAFVHNSGKILLGGNFLCLPIALTYSYGYNLTLANFGKPLSSFGVAAVLNSFKVPRDLRLHRIGAYE